MGNQVNQAAEEVESEYDQGRLDCKIFKKIPLMNAKSAWVEETLKNPQE